MTFWNMGQLAECSFSPQKNHSTLMSICTVPELRLKMLDFITIGLLDLASRAATNYVNIKPMGHSSPLIVYILQVYSTPNQAHYTRKDQFRVRKVQYCTGEEGTVHGRRVQFRGGGYSSGTEGYSTEEEGTVQGTRVQFRGGGVSVQSLHLPCVLYLLISPVSSISSFPLCTLSPYLPCVLYLFRPPPPPTVYLSGVMPLLCHRHLLQCLVALCYE